MYIPILHLQKKVFVDRRKHCNKFHIHIVKMFNSTGEKFSLTTSFFFTESQRKAVRIFITDFTFNPSSVLIFHFLDRFSGFVIRCHDGNWGVGSCRFRLGSIFTLVGHTLQESGFIIISDLLGVGSSE